MDDYEVENAVPGGLRVGRLHPTGHNFLTYDDSRGGTYRYLLIGFSAARVAASS
jgi:hypothetical protein